MRAGITQVPSQPPGADTSLLAQDTEGLWLQQ